MKILTRVTLFVLFMIPLVSCENESESVPEIASDIQLLKQSIDFRSLEENFGKPDFDNMIEEKNTEYNTTIYSIPFFTPEYKQSVLIATITNGVYESGKTFISSLEASDKNFDHRSSTDSFKGVFTTYNLTSNEPMYKRDIDTELNETRVGDGCIRAEPYEGMDTCTTDQVGSCTGYKFSCMGWFETAACFASFPACMAALAADCTLELCLDGDDSNDYWY